MIDQAGGIFFALIAIAVAVVVALLLYEAWALLSGRKPITLYVRDGIARFPHWAALVAFLAGLLGGHFWR